MATFDEAVERFLSRGRIAVLGVSRSDDQPANLILRRLREGDRDREVLAVNPAAEEVEGGPCWTDVREIPGGVEAAVVCVPPAAAADAVRACAEAGAGTVWLHRSLGAGSVSGEAIAAGRELGMTVLAGGCPMMFCAPVDPFHRCLRGVLRVFGRLPVHSPTPGDGA